jgi:putative ABC transport system ATP-binding protein
VIFADEPTGNLDSRSGGEILAFLRWAVDELGQTIVMVTHDPVAAAYADAVVFLADGRVVDQMPAPTAERVLERLQGLALGRDPGPSGRPRRGDGRHVRAGNTSEFGS